MKSKLKVVKCPQCKRRWAWLSDQAAAIKVVGHCIICHSKAEGGYGGLDVRALVTRLDEDGIIAERKLREQKAGYVVEPCSLCLHRRDTNDCKTCDGLGSVRVDIDEKEKAADSAGNG